MFREDYSTITVKPSRAKQVPSPARRRMPRPDHTDTACAFSEGRGWAEDFVLLFDKNKDFMRAMNVSVVPHVFVIDGKGKIVYSHTSYTPGSELELLEAIKKCSK